MSWWQRWFRGAEQKSTIYERWLELLNAAGGQTRSGKAVNWTTALEVTTVLACVRVISEGVAQVPFKVFRQDGATRMPAPDHPLYPLLHRQPNPWQSSFDFRQTMTMHAALTGNAFALINRLPTGVPGELLVIEPHRVTVKRSARGVRTYAIRGDGGVEVEYEQESVWHLAGPSWNGFAGMDAVHMAREAIGLAIATEEAHAQMHARGLRTAGTYSVEGTLNKEQHTQILEVLAKYAGEGSNSGKPMVLDRGAKWLQTGMSGVDAQHLETRDHQVEEICRAFRVLPIMVGFSDKTATYASAEQMFLAHVVHTLAPWYERIEQSAENALLSGADRRNGYYLKFLPAGLLRGAAKDRAEFYSKALGSGGGPAWMTQDEIRELEELNPMGGAAAALPIPTNVGGGNDRTTQP